MRSIKKQGTGGQHLNQSHTRPPTTGSEATSRWSGFSHKPVVLGYLLDEQYHLCCYSELRADEEGLGYHIEHVENKSQNPPRTFEYGNLAASALHSSGDLPTFKAQGYEVFGGHARGKQVACDMSRFVSCHLDDCRRFFAYLSDGRVVPSGQLDAVERDKAQYTIDTVNLNSPYLVVRRRQWWAELDALFEEHAAKDWDLAQLVAVDLVPSKDHLSRFFSLTRQFFGEIADQVLKHEAPQLV